MKNKNIFFLVICLFIILCGMFTLIKTQKTKSYLENRNLVFFPHFTLIDYVNGKYQNDFSNALSDQFILSETVKRNIKSLISFTNYKNSNKYFCENRYLKVDYEAATFNCDSRLVYIPKKYSKKMDKLCEKNIENLNKIMKDESLYYYFINESSNFDFGDNKKIYDLNKYFGKNKYREFLFENYTEFKKYFYKTDHHWNYKGSYKGYNDIIDMLFDGGEKGKQDKKLIDFHVKFNGSLARTAVMTDFSDNLKTYKFNLDEHDEFIEGELGHYGALQSYLKGDISSDIYANHYGHLYGYDVNEIVFDYYNNDSKDNLLIIANSYSNPINNLIASHFHKTYVIDLRYYITKDNPTFNVKKYMKDNNIDKVLLMGSVDFFSDKLLESVVGE